MLHPYKQHSLKQGFSNFFSLRPKTKKKFDVSQDQNLQKYIQIYNIVPFECLVDDREDIIKNHHFSLSPPHSQVTPQLTAFQ